MSLVDINNVVGNWQPLGFQFLSIAFAACCTPIHVVWYALGPFRHHSTVLLLPCCNYFLVNTWKIHACKIRIYLKVVVQNGTTHNMEKSIPFATCQTSKRCSMLGRCSFINFLIWTWRSVTSLRTVMWCPSRYCNPLLNPSSSMPAEFFTSLTWVYVWLLTLSCSCFHMKCYFSKPNSFVVYTGMQDDKACIFWCSIFLHLQFALHVITAWRMKT